jgi:pimeloyl-ACP methyl ester carboxylesterase
MQRLACRFSYCHYIVIRYLCQAPDLAQQQTGIGAGPSLEAAAFAEVQNTDARQGNLLSCRGNPEKIFLLCSGDKVAGGQRVPLLDYFLDGDSCIRKHPPESTVEVLHAFKTWFNTLVSVQHDVVRVETEIPFSFLRVSKALNSLVEIFPVGHDAILCILNSVIMPASTTLVLIPGLLCNEDLWSSQVAGLARFADSVVADVTKQETIAEMAAAVLDSAPAHFSLAGFSLGGQVALEIMSTHPDRVQQLALLSTTHGELLPVFVSAFQQAIETIEQGGFQSYLDGVYPRYFSPAHTADPAFKRCFMEMAQAVGPEAGVRQMRALLGIKGTFPHLDQIHCPALILGGREDRRTTPAAHETLAREIPGSELVIVDQAAHFTTLEQPDIVTQAMQRWMTSRRP